MVTEDHLVVEDCLLVYELTDLVVYFLFLLAELVLEGFFGRGRTLHLFGHRIFFGSRQATGNTLRRPHEGVQQLLG